MRAKIISTALLLLLFSQPMRNQNYKSKINLIDNRLEMLDNSSVYTSNNPVNVRHYSNNDWNGLIGYDNGYCKFDSVENGYRASFKLIKKYIRDYDLRTIEEIIQRYAPKNENDTEGYIKNVEKWSGIKRNSKISSCLYQIYLSVGAPFKLTRLGVFINSI